MNKYIIISKEDAEQIKGNYGEQRMDGTFPARIEPVAVPDGTYTFPESCLEGYGLESVKDELESMITADNVKEIKELPKQGNFALQEKFINTIRKIWTAITVWLNAYKHTIEQNTI